MESPLRRRASSLSSTKAAVWSPICNKSAAKRNSCCHDGRTPTLVDYINVIAYNDDATSALGELRVVDQKTADELNNFLDTLQMSGGTKLEWAIEVASRRKLQNMIARSLQSCLRMVRTTASVQCFNKFTP